MNKIADLILGAIRDPSSTVELSPEEWDLVIRLARRTSLLSHLAVGIQDEAAMGRIPGRARNALNSAISEVAKLQQMGSWEIDRIARALKGSGIQMVLLKGMAYFKAEIPHARGRPFSDVDVLIPHHQLEQAESLLKQSGWTSVKTDVYDEMYYRQWMHELAPLRHEERETVVDLHHAVVPRTSRLKMNSELLFIKTKRSAGTDWEYLQPTDMLIHAAVHLFHDGDLGDSLRELLDVDQLTRHFAASDSQFLSKLISRADELGAGRTVFYAMRYAHLLLDTPIPLSAMKELEHRRPAWLILRIMDVLAPMALIPEHPDRKKKLIGLARWCLYVRSHYLRMPLKLLIPHLLHKSRRRHKTYFELIGTER